MSAYKEFTDYFLSMGYSNADPLVCEKRYNMAMAYRNNGNYAEAMEILLEVRIINPDYEPEILGEQLYLLFRVISRVN